MRKHSISTWRGVHAGSCHAWPLPADATCATVARQVFREAIDEIRLEPELVDDCVLMASELAANTLHARAAAGAGGGGDRLVSAAADWEGKSTVSAGPDPSAPSPSPAHSAPPASSGSSDPTEDPADASLPVPGCPELWLYLRGIGARRELVCKIFDCYRGWRHGAAPSPDAASRPSFQDVAGRGLQIVHELSGGRWGHHPTRARLGGWGLRGKAVWFAVPAPLAHARLADVTGLRSYTLSADVAASRAGGRLSARQAAMQLHAMLDERGFGGKLMRVDRPGDDMSVLSVRCGLTVWCRSGTMSLTTPEGSVQSWDYVDLIDAAEQTVRWYEELDMDLAPV